MGFCYFQTNSFESCLIIELFRASLKVPCTKISSSSIRARYYFLRAFINAKAFKLETNPLLPKLSNTIQAHKNNCTSVERYSTEVNVCALDPAAPGSFPDIPDFFHIKNCLSCQVLLVALQWTLEA